jgi:solute carrier family 45, member 1/2/4
VSAYHAKGTFKNKGQETTTSSTEKIEPAIVEPERGLGLDCGIVGSCLFVAQFTMSLSIGSFISLLGSTTAIIYAASFFSLLSAISACFVVYMDL